MAKLKDYTPFPKGLGVLAPEHRPVKKMSARGKKAMKNDILETAIPFAIAGTLLYFIVRKTTPAVDPGRLVKDFGTPNK
jgi:hypothetical protein